METLRDGLAKGVHRSSHEVDRTADAERESGRKPERSGQADAAGPPPLGRHTTDRSPDHSSRAADIVTLKQLVPRVRPMLVRRDRLITRLEAGMKGLLTLLCAPAGYGKTTLLVDWLRSWTPAVQAARAAAWVALDESDNEPRQFASRLVGALRIVAPECGKMASAGDPEPSLTRTLLTLLVNELAASNRDVVLVLEDYHVITRAAVHRAVEFLLEHRPPRLKMVIATREDPPFALSRLRVQGVMCELRADDLRFLDAETAAFFRDVMDLPITADEAAAVGAYTEGWIAGLQLVALSTPEGNVSSVIANSRGTRRMILDYLGEEVLARQPGPVQSFLLRTSVLDPLSGSLCEAVLAEERPEGGAQAMLERVERANLFLSPLDAERRWYRYHALFADFLRVRLEQEGAVTAAVLNRRASEWYEARGLMKEAIAYALAASDFDRAARLIEPHQLSFLLQGHVQTMLDWYRAFPTPSVESRALLGVGYAWALYLTGNARAAEASLRTAEQHLESDLPAEEVGCVRGRIALLRAVMRSENGDLSGSSGLAERALHLLPSSDALSRAIARFYIEWQAFRVTGDVTSDRERAIAAAAEEAQAAGAPVIARNALALLARVHVVQGQLRRAAAEYRQIAHVMGQQVVTSLAAHFFGIGDLLREWNDLDGADRHLRQGVEVVTEANVVGSHAAALGYTASARLRHAQGHHQDAMAALDELVALARRREFAAPVLAYAGAARAHLWLMQGNLAAAAYWADTCGLSPDGPIDLLREPEYVILARVLIAKKNRATVGLLDRLLAGAEARGRMGNAIELLVLRALALQALGQPVAALASLERALALGEPEGYVRVFVDEGPPMAVLLRRARLRGIAPEYAARLLSVFGAQAAVPNEVHPVPPGFLGTGRVQPGESTHSLEPLTAREREVLRLIVAGASNEQIARTLVVSSGTVKTHVYHIFSKLGIRSRTQAIAKAREFRLD